MNSRDVLFLFFGWLHATIPYGPIIARAKGIDLTTFGSGNMGATNVERALGKKWATIVLVLDALKGVIPFYLYLSTGGDKLIAVTLALVVLLGHTTTPFLRQGGKGVATSLGIVLVLTWPIGLGGIILSLLIKAILGKSHAQRTAIASTVTVWLALVVFLVWRANDPTMPLEYVVISALIAIIVTQRHRDNFAQLFGKV